MLSRNDEVGVPAERVTDTSRPTVGSPPAIMTDSFPLAAVRAAFPALRANPGCVYLDNPAGTQVPDGVIEAVADCYRRSYANLGGAFATSRSADAIVARAHERAALFVGAASAEEIAIGASMTELTYHLARSLVRDLQPGDEILVTSMDHEGNVSPWLQAAADVDVKVTTLRFDRATWRVEPEGLAAALGPRTRVLALTCASNLTGAVNDLARLVPLARDAGVLTYLDAVQFAPHALIDVAALGCDFLVCSAYKFFGPHISLLWGRRPLLDRLQAERLRCGPTGPGEKFERGTPQIELQAGLAAAVDYLCWLGRQAGAEGDERAALARAYAAAGRHEAGLMRRLIGGLTALPGVRLQGPCDLQDLSGRVPTVSFTSDRVTCRALAAGLAERGIFAWSGHNYAYGIARQLGLDMEDGVLRLGIAHYNSEDEIERTLETVAALTA